MDFFGVHTSILELVAIITGLFSIYYASKINKFTWLIGFISQVCYFVLFYNTGLFANAGLQIFYCAICIYGWIYWKNDNHKITILSIKNKLIILFCSILGILLLSYINPSENTLLDSTITVFSIVGSILLSKKILDTWYLWIIVNILAIYLFFKVGLVLVSISYILALINSLIAIYKWKKEV